MKIEVNKMKTKLGSNMVLLILITSLFVTIPKLDLINANNNTPDSYSREELLKLLEQQNQGLSGFETEEESVYPDDIDLASFLKDYPNYYSQIYQPWKTKAAIRCIEITDDYQYMIVGGGYLYDNEVHIYRWNPVINQYVKVWTCGDGIIKEDVIDVDIADTDHNNFLEIAAASADGSFHVFEQKHLYDPNTNTENMFEHVYSSPYLGQVWSVEINDTDLDYDPDIIVVSWDYKVHIFEYTIHSGYPFTPEHWIEYQEKWSSQNLRQHPTSLVVGDTNYNGLPDFVVGTREGGIFIFENNGTVLDINGEPFPLCQDNSYKLIYNDSSSIWRPIYSMDIGNLDYKPGDEVVIASFAFNGYILRYNKYLETYYLQKLIKDFEPWTLKDFYPADYYIDNVTYGQNIYFNDPNYSGTSTPEPISMLEADPYIYTNYPYNSGTAQKNETCWTFFDQNTTHASWAILDFGNDEEGTGNGNNKIDFSIALRKHLAGSYIDETELANFLIKISPDNEHWLEIDPSDMSVGYDGSSGHYTIDVNVDPILIDNQWNYFRYVNFTVLNNTQDYDTFWMKIHYVNIRVDTALCAEIGTLASSILDSGSLISTQEKNALLGTVDGRIVAFKYNLLTDEFDLEWDSWVDDRFSVGTNIWDLEQVETLGTMPMLLGLTNLDTDYLWIPEPQPSWTYGVRVFDYDIQDIDQDAFVSGDFVTSFEDGQIRVFTNSWVDNPTLTINHFSIVNSWPNYIIGRNLSVSVFNIDTDYTGPELFIGWFDDSVSNVYDDYYDDTYTSMPADIDYWHRVGTQYDIPVSLSSIERTGQLAEILKSAQSIPSADGVDIDGDGDMDIVVCIDNLYLLWNIGDATNPSFILDSTYFEGVNEEQGKRKFFSPQFVEFDHDNDFDLCLGYSNRVGATYFENYGTLLHPLWEEKKELLNNFDEDATINVYNLTRPLFVSYQDFSVYWTLALGEEYYDKYYIFNMFEYYTNDISLFQIKYDIQTSYMIATYPLLSKLEINSFKSLVGETIYGTSTYRNFGFRAIESWTTRSELLNWTLTVETGDLDEDGKGEIIVGDYDNNIYIFEHMLNNTYKRAFRFQDMYSNYPTDDSPYAWDQFGTFFGEFNQTVWNHVTHILVGVDLDNNGYQELVALAGTVIYIFEVVYDDFSGRIIDDTYRLVYQYDLLLHEEASYLREQGYLEPTGLTWAKDLDQDGYSEIIIALESQVFVYTPLTNKMYELFGLVPDKTDTGHYNLPGNSRVFDNFTISGIRVFDTNENGIEELIVYGDIGKIGFYETGYLAVIESNYLGYHIIWQAPSSVVKNNVINTVEITDQDIDGLWEIIIGGDKGLSIWEFNGTTDLTDFQQVSVVTGHMNYPVMDSNSVLGSSSRFTSDDQIKQRSHDIIQFIYGTTNHSYLAVWSQYNPSNNCIMLYQAVSSDGQTWHSKHAMFAGSIGNNAQLFPSLTQDNSGTIYLMWTQKYGDISGSSLYALFVQKSEDLGTTWQNIAGFGSVNATIIVGSNPYRSPTIYPYSSLGFGFSYIYRTNSTYSLALYGFLFENGTLVEPKIYPDLDEFHLNGIDVTSKPDNSYTYAAAISAHKKTENKDDYDIWFMEMNRRFNYTLEPRKLVESAAVEHTPSIAYLTQGTYPLVITYDAAGYKQAMSTSYGMVTLDYLEWSKPDILAVYPSYIELATDGYSPRFTSWLSYAMDDIGFRAPKVTPTYTGEFALLTKLDITGARVFPLPVTDYWWEDLLCQVYSLDVTSFTPLWEVTDLSVGDSDGDGLREILVADGEKVRLLELYSTLSNFHGYKGVWRSMDFDTVVTDVSLFDSNGNGFDELIFTVKGDDTFVFETQNLLVPIVDLKVPYVDYTTFISNTHDFKRSLSIDLDDDGFLDYVVVMSTGEIYAFYGSNGTLAWSITSIADIIEVFKIGTYFNKTAIFALYDSSAVYWIAKNNGTIFTSYLLSAADHFTDRCVLYDFTNDTTDDIYANTEAYSFSIYDGKDGVITSYSFGLDVGDKIVGIGIAYNISSPTIILAIDNDTVYGCDSLLEVEWSFSLNIVGNSRVLPGDLDDDGIDEVYVTGTTSTLIMPNGTWIWNISTPAASTQAFFVDITDDGIKDIITNYGHSYVASAYDGTNGELLWTQVTPVFWAGEFSLGTYNDESTLFFNYINLIEGYWGVGAMTLLGALKWVVKTTTSGSNDPRFPLPVVVNNQLGVAVFNDQTQIEVYSARNISYEFTHQVLDQISFETIYHSQYDIEGKTAILDRFYGGENPYLFFIEHGNKAVLYNLTSSTVDNSTELPILGNVTWAVPGDIYVNGYPTAIYFITDAFEIGLLTVQDMTIQFLIDESNSIQEFYYAISSKTKDGPDGFFYSIKYKGQYEIRSKNRDGSKVLDTIVNGVQPYKQLLTGHLLPVAGIDGDFLLGVRDSVIEVYQLNDGSLYLTIDGTIGLVDVAQRAAAHSYEHIYYHNYDDIVCYDMYNLANAWIYQVGIQEILDFAFLNYDADSGNTYMDVYASQNGTGVFLIKDRAAFTPIIIWYHEHNSFEAKYLRILQDTNNEDRLLIGDYHRLFLNEKDSDNIYAATSGLFGQISYLNIWHHGGAIDQVSITFLIGKTFYSHNMSTYIISGSSYDADIPLTIQRIIQLIVPTTIIISFFIWAILILFKKPKLRL